ncbi:hypothetical protein DNTS_029730 [Danionella cerebrum]|uniref:Uncharacterized protein n=1 Tax=Danionella cerebrum TaxID=2873325 RepID=A0A553N494_9TELE|nr:hypothetical protein DNTS_029730 [Danionella translucida]
MCRFERSLKSLTTRMPERVQRLLSSAPPSLHEDEEDEDACMRTAVKDPHSFTYTDTEAAPQKISDCSSPRTSC